MREQPLDSSWQWDAGTTIRSSRWSNISSQSSRRDVRATVMAGVNAAPLREGPEETIVDNVKRFIDKLGRDHNLTAVPRQHPGRHAFPTTCMPRWLPVHTYGRLPLAENLDDGRRLPSPSASRSRNTWTRCQQR